MTAAVRFLITASVDTSPLLYYYGLPLSMVAAALLIALRCKWPAQWPPSGVIASNYGV